MKFFFISISIFSVLAFSRFIPHPPNFTNLIALSFYVPLILGVKFIPVLILCFALTDIIIGYHTGTFFTWGSVFLIGLLSIYFGKNLSIRISGVLLGALVFFIVTNFGVWASGMYGYTLSGLINCFILAIPFFGYSLVSTLIYATIIETLLRFSFLKKLLSKKLVKL
jgi:hypothetical protein